MHIRLNCTASLGRYLFKPCDTSWKDGIIALEAGEAQALHTRQYCCVQNPDERAFSVFLAARLGDGNSAAAAQQRCRSLRPNVCTPNLFAHSVSRRFPFLFPLRDNGRHDDRLSLLLHVQLFHH